MADADREALMQIVKAQLEEQRRSRRWKLVFRFTFLGLLALFVLTFVLSPRYGVTPTPRTVGDHAALIRLEGVIFSGAQDSNAEEVNASLREAFENASARIIILEINTPGGSPVQSSYIADEILRLREEYPDKPVYAVISDMCTSGGMYVAVSASRIYANPASLIGSVGVIFSGFGFVDAIRRLGVERRLIIAGENKAMLDPFSPQKPEQVAHMQQMLDQIHRQFIEHVRKERGEKLREGTELFDGLFWTGEEALQLGLIDEFGDVRYVAEQVGKLAEVVEYRQPRMWWETLSDNLVMAVSNRLFALFAQPRLH